MSAGDLSWCWGIALVWLGRVLWADDHSLGPWQRRNNDSINQHLYISLSLAIPERLLKWHRKRRQFPDDATKRSSRPHCVLHALLLLAIGNCCLLPVSWGNVKTSPDNSEFCIHGVAITPHQKESSPKPKCGQDILQGSGRWLSRVVCSPPWYVSVTVVVVLWDTLLRGDSTKYFRF